MNGYLTSVTLGADTLWTLRKQNPRLLPTRIGLGGLNMSLNEPLCPPYIPPKAGDYIAADKEQHRLSPSSGGTEGDPYGALMGGGTVNNPGIQPYKYGTKEFDRQNGLDWYDSQARMYDPLLGRTPTMDPLSEKYYSISHYAWCAGNPVRLVDPTGQFYTDNIKDDTIYPLIAFFPSERDKALEIDYQVAREQNVPMFVVDNLNDFVDAMSCLTDMLGSTAMAIAINSHGSPGSFYIA